MIVSGKQRRIGGIRRAQRRRRSPRPARAPSRFSYDGHAHTGTRQGTARRTTARPAYCCDAGSERASRTLPCSCALAGLLLLLGHAAKVEDVVAPVRAARAARAARERSEEGWRGGPGGGRRTGSEPRPSCPRRRRQCTPRCSPAARARGETGGAPVSPDPREPRLRAGGDEPAGSCKSRPRRGTLLAAHRACQVAARARFRQQRRLCGERAAHPCTPCPTSIAR